MVRQVRVPIVVALMGMMFQMKNAKTHRARCDVWKVGDYRDHLIPARAPENQVMRRIMLNCRRARHSQDDAPF